MGKDASPNRQSDFPSPPNPKDVLAFLRWIGAFWKASPSLRRQQSQTPQPDPIGHESIITVVIAISTDLLMLVAKAFAAASTSSSALFAETLHSVADTANEILLLNGLRRARMRPDLRHPFGYGAEAFFWSLLAALGIIILGGVLAIWEGIDRLLHPGDLQSSFLGLAVLAVGCLLDGTSWIVSVRQLRREASQRGISLKRHIRSTTNTAVTSVYYEDSAALIGDLIALAGLGIHQIVNSPLPDTVAGIAVGLLLTIVGLRLAARNRDLLTHRSESPILLDRVRRLLAANPEVVAVGKVISMIVGPHRLLVVAEVQPVDNISGHRLCQLLDKLRRSIAETTQRSAVVFLMPVALVEQQQEPTPWSQDYWLRLFPDDEQS